MERGGKLDIYSEQLKEKRLEVIKSMSELIIKLYDKKAYIEFIGFLIIMPDDIEKIATNDNFFKYYVRKCQQITRKALDRKYDKIIKEWNK